MLVGPSALLNTTDNATKRQRPLIFVQTDMRRMLNLMNKVRDKENYCRKVFSDTICVSADSMP